jgi:Protein of unknown function (DUF3365)
MKPCTRKVRRTSAVLAVALLAAIGAGATGPQGEKKPAEVNAKAPVTLEVARAQARLLHEIFHVTLQVVHRDYYRQDEGLLIPSRSLEAVFDELAHGGNVQLHWLAVNAQAMNVDHRARTDFEKDAVKALGSGKDSFEFVGNDVYRYAGSITLFSQCLKCHVPNRTSNEARTAALVVTVPIKKN